MNISLEKMRSWKIHPSLVRSLCPGSFKYLKMPYLCLITASNLQRDGWCFKTLPALSLWGSGSLCVPNGDTPLETIPSSLTQRGRHPHSWPDSKHLPDSSKVSPSLKNVFLVTFSPPPPLQITMHVNDKSKRRGHSSLEQPTIPWPSTSWHHSCGLSLLWPIAVSQGFPYFSQNIACVCVF